MRVINFEYPKNITKNDPMVIYVFADLHVGNESFDEQLSRKHVDMCRDEKAYWIGGGDYAEAVNPKDKRFDVRTVSNPIIEQYALVEELFSPIADKCLAMLTGNHDEKLAKDFGDFVGVMSKRLNVPYMGFSGFLNILMKHSTREKTQHTFTLFLHHGHAAGRLIGSKAINLHRLSHKYDANMYIVGHAHSYFSHIDEIVTQKKSRKNTWRMFNKHRYYVSCPAYLDAYSGEQNYVTKAAYQPQSTGCVRIELFRSNDKVNKNDEIMARIQPLLKGM